MRALHTVIMFFVGILYYFLLRMPGHRLSKTGASLLVGGGLNNLLDRYTKGYVVDYVKFNFGPKWLRGIIFNISQDYSGKPAAYRNCFCELSALSDLAAA